MEVLVSTNEAANILGLSVQGVHYRIKTKKLKSIKKDNKTFVYIDQSLVHKQPSKEEQSKQIETDVTKEIIKLKDEQISFLKKSIAWITKRNNKEIARLQNSHDKVIDAFKSEISLLQKAYNELHKLYKTEQEKIVDNSNNNEEIKKHFLSVQEFVSLLLDHGKDTFEIKSLIIDKVRQRDKRFVYNSITKELKILNDNFKDIL